MQEFDYRAAWEDVARPAFDALSPPVLALYRAVCERSDKLTQGPTLAVPMPPDLLPMFEAIETLELARAAHALHFYEHWSHDGHAQQTCGAGWKFSNLADQVLATKTGLRSRFERDNRGKTVRIIDGMVRVQYAPWNPRHRDIDFWTWAEIGYPTPEVLAAAAAVATDGTMEGFEAETKPLRAKFYPPEWDAARYMTEKGKARHDCKACGRSPLWKDIRSNHNADCSVLREITLAAQAEGT